MRRQASRSDCRRPAKRRRGEGWAGPSGGARAEPPAQPPGPGGRNPRGPWRGSRLRACGPAWTPEAIARDFEERPRQARPRVEAGERDPRAPRALDLPACSPRGLEAPERDSKPQAAWEGPRHGAGAALQGSDPGRGLGGPARLGVGLTACPPLGASGVGEAGGRRRRWDPKHRGDQARARPLTGLHRERPGPDAGRHTATAKAPLPLPRPATFPKAKPSAPVSGL